MAFALLCFAMKLKTWQSYMSHVPDPGNGIRSALLYNDAESMTKLCITCKRSRGMAFASLCFAMMLKT